MNDFKQEDMTKIYERLVDEESKNIFENRLLYSLTEDMEYIYRIVKTTPEGNAYWEKFESDKRMVIFGAGVWGKNILHAYQKKCNIECFVDNGVKDGERCRCEGIPVISVEDYLRDYKDATVIISSRLYYQKIFAQLIANGVSESNIINIGGAINNMSKRQYFDLSVLEKGRTEQEVFVDGGAFDGKTSFEFYKWCKGAFHKIYLFEPDIGNREKCETNLKEIRQRVEIIPKGLWDRVEILKFTSLGNGSSYVGETDAAYEIQTTTMDEAIQEKVTFIKLDIEGSEYRALCGAKRLIKTYTPKLAISVYHRLEDIWKLPLLILSYNRNYSFYLRHYSLAASETVLYGVPD